jgi:hypothetical protein
MCFYALERKSIYLRIHEGGDDDKEEEDDDDDDDDDVLAFVHSFQRVLWRICMYVCMYVCMYICALAYVCMYVCFLAGVAAYQTSIWPNTCYDAMHINWCNFSVVPITSTFEIFRRLRKITHTR